ncbi:signal peptidase I [Flavobacterium arsenatis]|uniref:Signal peptidase I n=1 Tax=Flavobacterium arsenatis TaxID=1484332 RepID=A0ABU1TQT0_9FLAO|nr:signal peptidase I [Flavobacterium arsenatis]MDR6967748.1 signal peptidase I [Flavobacterium arsenatis]
MRLKPIIIIVSFFLLLTNINCQNDTKAFKNSTIANEPTLRLNSRITLSKSKIPKHNDFVAYSYNSEINGDELRIHKLVAKENDTLKIVDGIVSVNNINIDKGNNLIHFYKISKSDYLDIKKKENISDQFYAFPSGKDSVTVMIEDIIAEKYDWKAQRQIRKSGITDKTIKKLYGKDWNEDNFGPLIIPKNKVFVIGENRHNSEDSRYIGMIEVSQIVGVVIGQ